MIKFNRLPSRTAGLNFLRVTFAILLAPCAFAAPNPVLTLRDCISIALGESSSLDGGRLDLLAATEQINAARASTLPSLTGTGTVELFSGDQTGRFSLIAPDAGGGIGVNNGSGNESSGALDIFALRLRYPVFQDGSIFGLNTNDIPAVRAARAQREVLEWTRNLQREDVIYRITDAYVSTVAAQNRTQFVNRRVSLLEQTLSNVEQQQQQQLKLPIDVTVTRDQLGGARALVRAIREHAAAGKLEIAQLLGFSPGAGFTLASTLPEPPSPPNAEQLIVKAMGNHPTVRAQQATAERAKQNWRLERFRNYPSVNLNGTAIYADNFNPPGNHIFSGALTVSVPLWDFGAQRALARSRMYTYEAEKSRLGSRQEDVTYDIFKAYQAIYALSQNILIIQQEIIEADRNLRVATSQQEQGFGEPLTSLGVELTLVSKRDDLQALEARRLVLYAELQRAAGGSWRWLP